MVQLSYEQEREISSFVSREVIYCVSSLVQVLAQTAAESGKLADGTYYEDIMQICVQDDWKSLAREHIASMSREELIELVAEYTEEEKAESLSDAELQAKIVAHIEENNEWQEFAQDQFNLDPYTVEAYEHWIVSNWLADKLEAKGEMIGRDICGLTLWGRQTTGQAISMDSVIQEIYNDLNKGE